MSDKNKQLEKELEALQAKCALYEAWLRALDEYVDCDIWFKDKDSHYLYVNKRFESIIGFSREQLLHAQPADLFDPERAERIIAMDHKVMTENGLRRVIPCGHEGKLEMHDELRFPVKDEGGNIIGLGCIAFEVTRQSIAEEALTQAQTLARLGNWRWSVEDGCLISCSEEFAHILGCSIQEAFSLMHHRLESVVHPQDRQRVAAELAQAEREARGYRVEYRIVNGGGELRHVLEIAEPMLATDGRALEYIGTLQDISDRKAIEEELICAKRDLEKRVEERTAHLKYMAAHDNLTQVLNRPSFTENLLHRRTLYREPGQEFALILLDLDGFKGVNDYFGHDVGDKVLKVVAARLQNVLPIDSLLARVGGDEFAMAIFQESGLRAHCEKICDMIAHALREKISVDGLELYIGSCAGVCYADIDLDLDEAIKFADIALYKAKQNADRHTAVFEESMAREIAYFRALELDLRKAVTSDAIYIAYQPQIRISDGAIVGYEALARWDHPEYGAVSPEVFIAIAEDRGLVNILSENILRQCCKDFAKLQTLHTQPIKLAINLSPSQFHNPKLVESFKAIFAETNIEPDKFEMEVTESLFIKNIEHTRSTLQELRNMGVMIALDDFGTGYSSLGYLKEFHVDNIKLDRSFIKDVVTSKSDQRIVEGIVALVKNLGLQVVGEGVETDLQLQYLKSIGCDRVQGFLLGRPQRLEYYFTGS